MKSVKVPKRRSIKVILTLFASIILLSTALVGYHTIMYRLRHGELRDFVLQGDSESAANYVANQKSFGDLNDRFRYWWPVKNIYHDLNVVGIAAAEGDARTAIALVEAGLSPKPACAECRSPINLLLTMAANKPDELADAIRVFIEAGIDINSPDPVSGCTPLTQLFVGGSRPDQKLIDIMLSHGADPDAKSDCCPSARELAMRLGFNDVFDRDE